MQRRVPPLMPPVSLRVSTLRGQRFSAEVRSGSVAAGITFYRMPSPAAPFALHNRSPGRQAAPLLRMRNMAILDEVFQAATARLSGLPCRRLYKKICGMNFASRHQYFCQAAILDWLLPPFPAHFTRMLAIYPPPGHISGDGLFPWRAPLLPASSLFSI